MRGLLGAFFDIRIVVGAGGILLSVILHELFHIIMHWQEITAIALFPSTYAIVKITFTPAHHYDLILEEALAYTITAITLVFTAMLLHDIRDQRDTRSTAQIIMAKHYHGATAETERDTMLQYLGLMQKAPHMHTPRTK